MVKPTMYISNYCMILFKISVSFVNEKSLITVIAKYTVELRWLELEGIVKMCSSYLKFESPKFYNFREKKVQF
jgi:hypothetical protein